MFANRQLDLVVPIGRPVAQSIDNSLSRHDAAGGGGSSQHKYVAVTPTTRLSA
jgi:hypothetical protein